MTGLFWLTVWEIWSFMVQSMMPGTRPPPLPYTLASTVQTEFKLEVGASNQTPRSTHCNPLPPGDATFQRFSNLPKQGTSSIQSKVATPHPVRAGWSSVVGLLTPGNQAAICHVVLATVLPVICIFQFYFQHTGSVCVHCPSGPALL